MRFDPPGLRGFLVAATTWCAALYDGALCDPAVAQTSTPPPTAIERQACRDVAEQLRSAGPNSRGILSLDRHAPCGNESCLTSIGEEIGSGDDAQIKVMRLVHHLPDVPEWDWNAVRLMHLGKSSFVAVEFLEKLEACQDFYFYNLAVNGKSQYLNLYGHGGCLGEQGEGNPDLVGAVGEVPTIASQSGAPGGYSAELTTLQGSTDRPYCHLEIQLQTAFKIEQQSCQNSDCDAFRPIALDLARRADFDMDMSPYWIAANPGASPDTHKKQFETFFHDRDKQTLSTRESGTPDAVYRTVEFDGAPITLIDLNVNGWHSWFGILNAPETAKTTVMALSSTQLTRNDEVGIQLDEGIESDELSLHFGVMSTIVPVRYGGRKLLARVGTGYGELVGAEVGVFERNENGFRAVAAFIISKSDQGHPVVTER